MGKIQSIFESLGTHKGSLLTYQPKINEFTSVITVYKINSTFSSDITSRHFCTTWFALWSIMNFKISIFNSFKSIS